MKPRGVVSLLSRCMSQSGGVDWFAYETSSNILSVRFKSANTWISMFESVSLPGTKSIVPTIDKNGIVVDRFMVSWDCSSVVNRKKSGEDRQVSGFSFGKSVHKKARRIVTDQEDDGADMIGGIRHVGSGAISGLKSDASSDKWQQEAKQTGHLSFGLSVDILGKITREARLQDKQPMVFLRFTDIPDDIVMESDWVIIPRSAFEKEVG